MFPSRWTRDLDPLYIYSSSFWRYKTMTHPFLFLRALITSSWARTRHTKKDPTSAENNMLINHFPSSPTDWYARNIPTPKFMTSLCFSFSGQLRDRCPFFASPRAHIQKNIHTRTRDFPPSSLWCCLGTIACSCQERKMGKRKKKDFHLEGAETIADWSSLKKKMVAFFSSSFYVFSSFPLPTKGISSWRWPGGEQQKKVGRPAHTPRERKKKKEAHQKQQAAESRCAVVTKRPRGRNEKVAQPPFWAWPR